MRRRRNGSEDTAVPAACSGGYARQVVLLRDRQYPQRRTFRTFGLCANAPSAGAARHLGALGDIAMLLIPALG